MRFLLLFLTLPLLWAEVPASKAKAEPAAVSRATPSDAKLEATIRERFARSKINADKFQVRVKNGVATLDGFTNVIQHKGTATRIARTAGAAHVTNNIKISEGARQKASQQMQRARPVVKRSEDRSKN